MALPYELEVLDSLFADTIHPKNLIHENAVTTTKKLSAAEKTGQLQIAKVRKRLKPVAFGFLKEKHKKIYIRQHDSAVIQLLDALFHYLYPSDYKELAEKKTDCGVQKLYKRLFVQCSDLLEYIHDTFPEYISAEQKIPDYELMKAQQQWQARLVPLKRKLVRSKADKKLLQLLISLLSSLSDNTKCLRISYSKLSYINELFAGLENLKDLSNINKYFPPLTILVIYFNLNETEFKDCVVDSILEDVNSLTTAEERIEKLAFYCKEIRRIYIKPGAVFRQRVPSVKDDLKDWLAGEINYLEKTHSLGLIAPPDFNKTTAYKKGIWYTHTIEELACFKRIEHEAKFITNKNIIAMMEDFSKIAHTVGKHNISAKRLKNLFYSPGLKTIESVNNKLFLLINQLQKVKSIVIKKEKEKTITKRQTPSKK